MIVGLLTLRAAGPVEQEALSNDCWEVWENLLSKGSAGGACHICRAIEYIAFELYLRCGPQFSA